LGNPHLLSAYLTVVYSADVPKVTTVKEAVFMHVPSAQERVVLVLGLAFPPFKVPPVSAPV
jgi:hypothetical protein